MIKYFFFIIFPLFTILYAEAQTISGKIIGLAEGEKVWLYTNQEYRVEQKWSQSQPVDSTTVTGGYFTFKIPSTNYAKFWLLRTEKRPLSYFFNKNEDFYLEGTLNLQGVSNKKEVGDKENILFKDIFSILDKENITPIELRDGIEWLKRHAADDIASFATAYFYMAKKVLRPNDVKEIIDCIPEYQQQNPYLQLLIDYHKKDLRIQPGNQLPELTLLTSDGQKIDTSLLKNKPLIIYSYSRKDNGFIFLRKLKQIIPVQQAIPDLQIVLIHPKFSPDISSEITKEITGKRFISADYIKTAQATPELFYDKNKYQNIILVNKSTDILAINPMFEEYIELLKKDFPKDGFTINGYASGISEGIAELVVSKEGTLTTPEMIDTAIIQNGHFTFRGKLTSPQYCNIGIRNTEFPVGFYLENSPIDVNIRLSLNTNTKDGVSTTVKFLNGTVYGSHSEEEYQYLLNLDNPEIIESWLTKYPTNIPALFCIATTWMGKYPPELIEKWLDKIDKKLVNHIAYQEALKQIAKRKQLSAGKEAPGFTLPSETGKKISLKDFTGKYVLIDFWASWCGPCRQEIPNLKKAWEKYHKKGLEIISITIDRKEQEWHQALKNEKMSWTQLNGNGSKVPEMYNVQGVPHILLIGPDQKITAINLRGVKLEKKLAELFK